MNPVRVLLVEDEPTTRNDLAHKIARLPNLQLVATADRCATALTCLAQEHFDVLLIDMHLPDGDGSEIIARTRYLHPDALALVISVFGDEDYVLRAIRAGALGYLVKGVSEEELSAAITDLVNGISPLSPAVAHHLIKALQPGANALLPPLTSQLSARELEVLTFAAKGYTYAEIAQMIGVSLNTVSTYTRRVYSKLAVHSKTEAIYEATRLGLMTQD